MNGAIIGAFITAIGSLIGVMLTVHHGNKSHAKTSAEQTKLTVYRIEQLEKKIETFNTVNERLYIAEGQIKELQHEMINLHKEKAS